MPAPRPWLVSLAAVEADRWRAPIGCRASTNRRQPRLTSGAPRRGNRRRRSPRRAATKLYVIAIIASPLIRRRYDSARWKGEGYRKRPMLIGTDAGGSRRLAVQSAPLSKEFHSFLGKDIHFSFLFFGSHCLIFIRLMK